MTEKHIKNNYQNIIKYENVIENRKVTEMLNLDELIKENKYNLEMCKKYNNRYILLEDSYAVDLDLD